MTIDQFIALCASIGACISAIATFIVISQMAKQREVTYLPELVLSQTSFEARKHPEADGPIPILWTHKSETASTEQNILAPFSIPLTNIGLGAAKEVTVSWSFPLQKTIEEVNALAQKTLTPLFFDLNDGALSLKSETLGGGLSFWENQKIQVLDVVLSAAISREPTMLMVPPAYILLASSWCYLSAKEKDKVLWPVISPLEVKIDYSDIANKKRTASYNLNLRLVMFGGTGEVFFASFEPRKLQN